MLRVPFCSSHGKKLWILCFGFLKRLYGDDKCHIDGTENWCISSPSTCTQAARTATLQVFFGTAKDFLMVPEGIFCGDFFPHWASSSLRGLEAVETTRIPFRSAQQPQKWFSDTFLRASWAQLVNRRSKPIATEKRNKQNKETLRIITAVLS